MDSKFQKKLANNLMTLAIDLTQEGAVLDNEIKDIVNAEYKYKQAQFVLDELLAEYYKVHKLDSKDEIKV